MIYDISMTVFSGISIWKTFFYPTKIYTITISYKMKGAIMKKSILIFSFLVLSSCQRDYGVGPSHFDGNIPAWLQTKIDSMANDRKYLGTVVYRYEWKNEFVYHISIPISSCAFCELYRQSGERIQFANDSDLQNFLDHKKNKILIWAWEEWDK